MSYFDPPADEYRCVCTGENVRCTREWTNDDDQLCDMCRAARGSSGTD